MLIRPAPSVSAHNGPESPANTAGRTPRAANARTVAERTVEAVSYADHRREAHRHAALRALPADEHPPLPIDPVAPADVEVLDLGVAPGTVIRFETRYHRRPPAMRRIDGSGRVLFDAVAETLGWTPGLALDATCDGHWVTFRSAGRPRRPEERRLAHVDKAGRLVIPLGIRTYLGTDTGQDIILRVDAVAGTLQVADASLLARALDALERIEAAVHR